MIIHVVVQTMVEEEEVISFILDCLDLRINPLKNEGMMQPGVASVRNV